MNDDTTIGGISIPLEAGVMVSIHGIGEPMTLRVSEFLIPRLPNLAKGISVQITRDEAVRLADAFARMAAQEAKP